MVSIRRLTTTGTAEQGKHATKAGEFTIECLATGTCTNNCTSTRLSLVPRLMSSPYSLYHSLSLTLKPPSTPLGNLRSWGSRGATTSGIVLIQYNIDIRTIATKIQVEIPHTATPFPSLQPRQKFRHILTTFAERQVAHKWPSIFSSPRLPENYINP